MTVPASASFSVPTPDGRTLAVYEGGVPDGFPIIWVHGAPWSGRLYATWQPQAVEQGVRLLGYDRPGYGGSTRHPGRRVADGAADVHAIADALELERFAVWGISGGGPHALACAALCDERLAAAASLAAIGPRDAPGLDWEAGMGQGNIDACAAARDAEPVTRAHFERTRPRVEGDSARELSEQWSAILGGTDRAIMTGVLATYLTESIAFSLRNGVEGVVDDARAVFGDWGIDLGSIRRPVLVVHGDDDRFVPVAHGRWIASQVPGATAWIGGDDGHLSLMERRVGDVHAWLLSHR